MHEDPALFAIFILAYSSIAAVVERSWVSGPILFTCFGLLIGPFGLDMFSWETDRETILRLAEMTLALVLFTDAADANTGVLKKTWKLPARLLLIGLPLTILLGFGVGVLLLGGLSLFAVALLAIILAPTDAALGKAVITNPSVPDQIRQSLNLESGLNDGICVPILLVFLALALDQVVDMEPARFVVELLLKTFGIGIVFGLGLSLIAVQLLRIALKRQWLTPT
ncbi:MAG: hypothetical protein DRQ60_00720 [Gammaproteobacteria bacterium]|nr:MAG: hypothetical protein DRQ54_08200 [Gammaproteobacteria bacterium]RLA13658.1 MAG: hypothetical protein DRQ52_05835 [Gammaproteobacteria bacterium]RLA17941.1 MAG: hypothetical protein DRQ60_00720 [Gammaproteobacteria bacterium]